MLHFYCRQGGSSFADIKKLISGRIKSITSMNGYDQKKHHPFCDNETIRLGSWSEVDDARLPRDVGERVLKGLLSNSGLYIFFFLFLLKSITETNPREQENLWWSMTHIASVHLMKASRADAVRMWVGLLSSASGSISSGWQSRRSSANLLRRLVLGADWRSAVTLCVRLGTRGMLWMSLLENQGLGVMVYDVWLHTRHDNPFCLCFLVSQPNNEFNSVKT